MPYRRLKGTPGTQVHRFRNTQDDIQWPRPTSHMCPSFLPPKARVPHPAPTSESALCFLEKRQGVAARPLFSFRQGDQHGPPSRLPTPQQEEQSPLFESLHRPPDYVLLRFRRLAPRSPPTLIALLPRGHDPTGGRGGVWVVPSQASSIPTIAARRRRLSERTRDQAGNARLLSWRGTDR